MSMQHLEDIWDCLVVRGWVLVEPETIYSSRLRASDQKMEWDVLQATTGKRAHLVFQAIHPLGYRTTDLRDIWYVGIGEIDAEKLYFSKRSDPSWRRDLRALAWRL